MLLQERHHVRPHPSGKLFVVVAFSFIAPLHGNAAVWLGGCSFLLHHFDYWKFFVSGGRAARVQCNDDDFAVFFCSFLNLSKLST